MFRKMVLDCAVVRSRVKALPSRVEDMIFSLGPRSGFILL